MSALMTAYWFCFGFGLVYVLVAGTLGAVSHGMEAASDVDVDHDLDFDVDHDVDIDFDHDVDLDIDHDLDLDLDHDVDVDFDHDIDLDAGHAADLGHGGVTGHAINAGAMDFDHSLPSADLGHNTGISLDADAAADSDLDPDFAAIQGEAQREQKHSLPRWSPFSPLSIAGFLAAFGGTGLLAAGYELPLMLTLPIAIGGGVIMAIVLWLLVGKLLFGMMQGSSEARVIDMLGLEAEVLTPVEKDMSGEIAYILEGTRYTAPARLLEGDRVEKRSKVRICRMKGNMVYVRPQHKLLE